MGIDMWGSSDELAEFWDRVMALPASPPDPASDDGK